jgi:hypothetical protein
MSKYPHLLLTSGEGRGDKIGEGESSNFVGRIVGLGGGIDLAVDQESGLTRVSTSCSSSTVLGLSIAVGCEESTILTKGELNAYEGRREK